MIDRLLVAGTRRSLTLCAIGAVLGLLIAGFGLFTARGTRMAGMPPEDVAIVNQVPILRSDFNQQLRSLDDVSPSEATPAQKRKVLDDMIREELYIQRGVELGLTTDDTETRAALLTATESLVAQNALASVPTDAELHDFYKAHPDRYATIGMMALKALVPASRAAEDAAGAVAALKRGAPLAEVSRRFHLVSTGKVDDGIEFYFAARIHLGDAAFAVARRMQTGDVAGPVAGPDGPVVLIMKDNRRPVPQPYEVAKSRVSDDLIAAKMAQLTKANDRFLRKRAEVRIAADFK
jgi:hypothetical protein